MTQKKHTRLIQLNFVSAAFGFLEKTVPIIQVSSSWSAYPDQMVQGPFEGAERNLYDNYIQVHQSLAVRRTICGGQSAPDMKCG